MEVLWVVREHGWLSAQALSAMLRAVAKQMMF